jgi:WD40 repeat protein
MAVTSFSPQLLATGSVDGEICIWNTSSELFVRRLDQRKRHSNNTQTKVSKDFIFLLLLLYAFPFALLISYKTIQLILLLQH